jgi:hypothetical protein
LDGTFNVGHREARQELSSQDNSLCLSFKRRRRRFPHLDSVAAAANQNVGAVRAEGDGEHLIAIEERRADRLAGNRIPDPRRVIEASGDDQRSVGAEGRGVEALLVPQRSSHGLTRLGVPKLNRRRAL